MRYAGVAQLDRVTGYEPVGRGFESLRPYQPVSSKKMQVKNTTWKCGVFYFFIEIGRKTSKKLRFDIIEKLFGDSGKS